MTHRTLLALSGSTSWPSKTTGLTRSIADAVAARGGWQVACRDLSTLGPALGKAQSRTDADADLLNLWDAVETCDAMIVGTPTYKASYSGLLKHFFDLMDMRALEGRPVIVCATARAPGHALMIDHQLRPLFAFFNAIVMPTGLFATEADFTPEGTPGSALAARIERAASELHRFTSD